MKSLILILCLMAAPSSWAACSANDLNGNYAFELTGWFSTGIPASVTGVFNFDGVNRGKIIRSWASSWGTRERAYGVGKFLVRADCTAKWDSKDPVSGIRATTDIVIAGDTIFLQLTNATLAFSAAGTGKRIPQ